MSTVNEIFFTILGSAMKGNILGDEKHSINEIIEKSNVTEKEVLELLEAGIIRGKIIFGVPFITGDTPYSVEKKLSDWKKGGKNK